MYVLFFYLYKLQAFLFLFVLSEITTMRSWLSTIYFNCRSIVSIQTLSFIFCFSCITYLILSNFSQASVKNIISQTWIQSVSDQIVSKQEIDYRSGTRNTSFICDRTRRTGGVRETNVSSAIDDHLVNILGRK
jgi:hypothetical protein